MTTEKRTTDADGPLSQSTRLIGLYVNHDNALVRFVSLWVVVATAFTVAWVASYVLLPAGILRGGNPAATADYAGTVTREFVTLFAWNVAVSLIAVGANTFRPVNTPLGYIVLVVQAPRYGAIWGTGSLAIGSGVRVAPSLSVLVERSGPLENWSLLQSRPQ